MLINESSLLVILGETETWGRQLAYNKDEHLILGEMVMLLVASSYRNRCRQTLNLGILGQRVRLWGNDKKIDRFFF